MHLAKLPRSMRNFFFFFWHFVLFIKFYDFHDALRFLSELKRMYVVLGFLWPTYLKHQGAYVSVLKIEVIVLHIYYTSTLAFDEIMYI